MSVKIILRKIRKYLINFNIDGMKDAVQEAVMMGIPPLEVIEWMGKGMKDIGEKYENGELFLPELIMGGETMKAGIEILEPYSRAENAKMKGIVVIGTVEGDLHDLGKNIISMFLESAGFKVHNLGVDVPAEMFVEETKKTGADIVAMSALLSTTTLYIKTVIDELKKAGLRDKVKVIIGGAPLVEEDVEKLGVDAFGKNPISCLDICKKWMKEKY